MKHLADKLNFKDYEEKIYNQWLEKKCFHADETSDKPPFSMVIPPPNVTGSLHLGHALNNTLQDIMARYHRQKGFEVLWLAGTDHAGIATQNVVEKQLAAEGLTRHDLGREKFLEKVWEWKEESGGTIINQLKKLGASCDWDRLRFTMDEGLSESVKKVFVQLYKENLIYRGSYIINWCPRCLTALSDLEVEFEETNGKMYDIQYKIKDSDEVITIATARPETLLGDTAVAVNPNDERFQRLIGKTAIIPVINREVEIIADEYVAMDFGTGALKVTPAHDVNDFHLGQKHNLETINIFTPEAIMNDSTGEFEGFSKDEALKLILEKLEKLGQLGNIKDYNHNVSKCYRCSTTIEPRVSVQWFLDVKPLAKTAIEAVETGDIKFHPDSWKNLYYDWMNNIRDWCISRQLWWGHQIPAWYCEENHITVSLETPTKCETCGSTNLTRESDVLDTWFSSQLWAFAPMDWVGGDKDKESQIFQKFYPTSILSTAFDIIFFWVARMIMAGYHFTGKRPFSDVYIHALIRDKDGKKMSKSTGNVIDPLVITEQYGADALRFTLAAFAAQGRDIKFDASRVEGYYFFINKIWNAFRLITQHNAKESIILRELDHTVLLDEDKWILQKLKETTAEFETAINSYRFNDAAMSIHSFIKSYFCDWYLEIIKDRLYNEETQEEAVNTSLYIFEKALRILHPIMPFITEHIYSIMHNDNTFITLADFPKCEYDYTETFAKMNLITEAISLVRNIRGEYNISPATLLKVVVTSSEHEGVFQQHKDIVCRLARVKTILINEGTVKGAMNVGSGFEITIELEGVVNFQEEIQKLQKERKAVMKDFNLYGNKLKNERFLANASKQIIEKDKAKFAELEEKIQSIDSSIKKLEAFII